MRRSLRNSPPVTPTYIAKLIAKAEQLELLDAETILRSRQRSLAHPDDPATVEYIWSLLRSRNVPESDIAVLQRVPLTRAAAVKGMTYEQFRQAIGKNVTHSIDPSAFGPQMLAMSKAIAKLPATARLVFGAEVRTVHLDRPRGTEGASWDPRSVLRLTVRAGSTIDAKTSMHNIVHELGHALEEALDLNVTPWGSIYGNPPFVSDYAARNATEDFAETFAFLELYPRDLKRIAPEKYEDMRARVREYMRLRQT